MRRLFIILGVVLGIIVAAGIFLFLQISRPVTSDVPVAINDIPAGTVLHADMFRVAKLANVDRETLLKWITASEWSKADGKVVTSDIRAGFPVAEAQIDPNSSAAQESRLSLALVGPDEYYVVIPASPNDVGNFILPGDRIDLILSLGDAGNKEAVAVEQPGQAQNPNEVTTQIIITETAPMPMSKLVMQNMTVQHPLTRFGCNKFNIIAFAGRDTNRILGQLRRFRDGMSVRCHDLERHAMQVHGMNELTDANQTQTN